MRDLGEFWFSKKSKKHKHKSGKKHKKSDKETEEHKDEQKAEPKRDRNMSFNAEENNEVSFQKDVKSEKRESSQPPSGFHKERSSNQQESD